MSWTKTWFIIYFYIDCILENHFVSHCYYRRHQSSKLRDCLRIVHAQTGFMNENKIRRTRKRRRSGGWAQNIHETQNAKQNNQCLLILFSRLQSCFAWKRAIRISYYYFFSVSISSSTQRQILFVLLNFVALNHLKYLMGIKIPRQRYKNAFVRLFLILFFLFFFGFFFSVTLTLVRISFHIHKHIFSLVFYFYIAVQFLFDIFFSYFW